MHILPIGEPMYAKILSYKQEGECTFLKIEGNHKHMFEKCQASYGEIRIDDGRVISSIQRKKIYATIKDIADWMGDIPEYVKEILKFNFCGETGLEYFSLSDCDVTVAREFISFILDFVIEQGIPLKQLAIDRTDDISQYLWCCIKHKKCCVCGRPGEIHHVDTIGMGMDRKHYDDNGNEKMCLCRIHHTETHQIGKTAFFEKHKVYGVLYSGWYNGNIVLSIIIKVAKHNI